MLSRWCSVQQYTQMINIVLEAYNLIPQTQTSNSRAFEAEAYVFGETGGHVR